MKGKKKNPARDKRGRLLPGHTANPSGENGLKGLPDHKHVCEWYLNNYTFAEIRDLVSDKERMGKMNLFHAQIITQLAASVAGGKERGKERERLYDRLYGKPIQETRITGKDGASIEVTQAVLQKLSTDQLESIKSDAASSNKSR